MNAKTIKIGDQVIELDDKSFGVESAEVGDLLSVKEIDENGKPTKWEADNKLSDDIQELKGRVDELEKRPSGGSASVVGNRLVFGG